MPTINRDQVETLTAAADSSLALIVTKEDDVPRE